MPKDLFVAAHRGRTKRGRTLIASLVLHAALLVMLVGVSLSAALDGPQLLKRVDRFIVTAQPPELPPPPAVRHEIPDKVATLPNPNLAPLTAPVGLQPEVEIPAVGV